MKVLVTRPDKSGAELVAILQQHQINAIQYSPIEFTRGRELTQLPSVLASLNSGDYVLCVSKNAITFAHQILVKTQTQWRDDLHYFAIGRASAEYLASVCQQAVKFPTKFANSEAFLELVEMQNIKGKNFLILRADRGRELISSTAMQRGANVLPFECYKKVVKNDINEKMFFFKQERIDTIIISSCDILMMLFEKTALENKEWLMQCQLIVVSRRIAKLAIDLGYNKDNIIVSTQVNNSSLLTAIVSKLG
ncbi:MAG: uroporphyrinogen-III synthase [Pasteurella sp.]|nr:uroporphyrinogen-III synthase [Pasteurella sp.]